MSTIQGCSSYSTLTLIIRWKIINERNRVNRNSCTIFLIFFTQKSIRDWAGISERPTNSVLQENIAVKLRSCCTVLHYLMNDPKNIEQMILFWSVPKTDSLCLNLELHSCQHKSFFAPYFILIYRSVQLKRKVVLVNVFPLEQWALFTCKISGLC